MVNIMIRLFLVNSEHCRTALKTKSPVWEKRFHFNINDAFSVLKITVASEKMNSPLVKLSIYHLKKNLIILLALISINGCWIYILYWRFFILTLLDVLFVVDWRLIKDGVLLTCSMFRWWWDAPCFASPDDDCDDVDGDGGDDVWCLDGGGTRPAPPLQPSQEQWWATAPLAASQG